MDYIYRPWKNTEGQVGSYMLGPRAPERHKTETDEPLTGGRDDRLVCTQTNLLVKRLSLNRLQCGGCSTKYDTLTESQVVY